MVKQLETLLEEDTTSVFFLPYANFYPSDEPGTNRPVILMPYDETNDSFILLDDIAEAIYYYYWLDMLFKEGYFVDSIPLIGMMTLEYDPWVQKSTSIDPESLRRRIPRKMIVERLDKSLCDMLTRAHTDNLLRPRPLPLEATLLLYAQGKTGHPTP